MRRVTIGFAAAGSLALATFVAPAKPAAADNAPYLRPGLWRLHRDMGTQTVDIEKCGDPVQSWQMSKAELERTGCTQSPVTKTGNTYSFTTSCPSKNAVSKSLMTIDSDSAYKVEIISTYGGQTRSETLTATRVGDCKEP